MSEIKGQLLGIIITLSVFGVAIAAMITAFENSSQTIEKRVEDAAYTGTVKPAGRVHNDFTLKY